MSESYENDGNFEAAEGDGVVVDLSGDDGDEGGRPEILPRGVYETVISDLTFEYSSNSNPMWTIVLEVSEGEYTGRKLWARVVFTEKAKWRAKKDIAAFAPELLEGPFNPEEIADNGELLGRAVRAKVGIRRYEGRNVNEVRELLQSSVNDII